MWRRPPLACPRCASERGEAGELGTRICSECELEFRPRGRVQTHAGQVEAGRFAWLGPMLVMGVLGALVGISTAMNERPSPSPPSPPAIEIPTYVPPPIDFASLELDAVPIEGPPLELVTHRLERAEGRVLVTGLIAVPSRPAARPRVSVRFVDAAGEELGRVLADVACTRLDTLPCPFGFAGLEPPGCVAIELDARSDARWLDDLDPRVHLRFGFDDALEPTRVDVDRPELAEAHATLRRRGERVEVAVGLPAGQALREVEATLVGYAEASVVELVAPLPSPVGLAREVELPAQGHEIVRWQVWLSGRPP